MSSIKIVVMVFLLLLFYNSVFNLNAATRYQPQAAQIDASRVFGIQRNVNIDTH